MSGRREDGRSVDIRHPRKKPRLGKPRCATNDTADTCACSAYVEYRNHEAVCSECGLVLEQVTSSYARPGTVWQPMRAPPPVAESIDDFVVACCLCMRDDKNGHPFISMAFDRLNFSTSVADLLDAIHRVDGILLEELRGTQAIRAPHRTASTITPGNSCLYMNGIFFYVFFSLPLFVFFFCFL